MLKSFLYAILKVYIYIRSDWYEPVTFLLYRKVLNSENIGYNE